MRKQSVFVWYYTVMIRKWDITNEQSKRQCLDELLARIDEQEDSEFGVIAAQEMIDIVSKHLCPQIHNATLDEAKKSVHSKLADLEIDLDVLRVAS